MRIDRRDFVTWTAGALLGAGSARPQAREQQSLPSMLKPLPESGLQIDVLMHTGQTFGTFQPPGIMDGMGAWDWNATTVRLFVNHELAPNAGYRYPLANGTGLTGARISWIDIDKESRQIVDAGNAIREIRDRRGEIVTRPAQVSELWNEKVDKGLNNLCSAQGYSAGEFGFVDDILFSHEEVTSPERHPHGGTVWGLDVRSGQLWALPELGRGAWENVTAIRTDDQDSDDGHIALLLSDDLEFGGAPLYLWIGRKKPGAGYVARNGLAEGQLHVWTSYKDDRDPGDWNGTGSVRSGRFVPVSTRTAASAGKAGFDRDGYINDTGLRERAREVGAFMFSRPEDLHTRRKTGSTAVFCSAGHGDRFPADDWGTIYLIDVRIILDGDSPSATARLTILHDGDDFGDFGIRSPDNVVWASDDMIYVQEDKAARRHEFGGESGREASTWVIDPENPSDYRRIAEIDRSVVLPADARDFAHMVHGTWECTGLIDVSREFGAPADELLLITAVQAHTIRGGSLGGRRKLFQGGQLVMLSARRTAG